ncbi:hypothetical protein [Mycobacteroides abscessus]|uniref:hypothetical protein n=1 Tax=Mycobacteroides abscessus TaxID=36809 RepID=UPI00092A71B8|nr:hypothetical protein [Mycobacteroides abscessus]MDO3333388.1 hypothetical protein [Mycobacteroides abscessus subsp. bolletii]QSM89862.1 hypothetical protein I3U44_03795 [Mycobacteroides abscessus subsp. bolletii]SIC06940.1 Uncharacterised protein [Mycobacteroides abscessus subsp. bolletii]SIJ50804.1 Uncharacterised protein [Mycobacteroides abscessus subsp. bolletii]SKS56878.1 Uncharacterised protein [Mycobacteroides abscessus subsp. bolletii]
MAERTRKIVFGRINRRNPDQEPLEMREFSEDMAALAESHLTSHVIRSTVGHPVRRWIAGDMTITPGGDFLTGVLGFSEQQLHVTFDDQSFSWMKAEVEDSDTANERTIAPFAVDLRAKHRWVAFATTARLTPHVSRKGFELVLNEAVSALGLMPTTWEVDLVTSTAVIDKWLRQNPLVHRLRRTLKFSNPGKDLDDDRRQMRALAANRKTEEFKAVTRGVLDINSPEFRNKLEGTETGDLDVVMEARGRHGVGNVVFNTRESVDASRVPDFGANLQHGIDIVLAALREYVASKEPPEQPSLLGDE